MDKTHEFIILKKSNYFHTWQGNKYLNKDGLYELACCCHAYANLYLYLYV